VELQKSVCDDIVDSIQSGDLQAAEDANDAEIERSAAIDENGSRADHNVA
jgi:hypothetical protein